MSADWLNINSSHIDSYCGEGTFQTLAEAVDGEDYWEHSADETHFAIFDLGLTYNIQKVRARSLTTRDPTSVNIYISDSKVDWGAAVASGISTWQDTDAWQEVAAAADGRYVKIEIVSTEHFTNYLRFGGDPPFKIFDIYGSPSLVGSLAAASGLSGILSSTRCLGSTVAIQSTAAASISWYKSLGTTSASCASVVAASTLSIVRELIATVTSNSNIPARKLKCSRELITTVAATTTASGTVSIEVWLVGSSDAQSSCTGLIQTAGLIGSLAATSGASAVLSAQYKLIGTVAAQSAVAAELTVSMIGTSTATSTVAGLLEITKKLIGTCGGVGTCAGSTKLLRELIASVDVHSTVVSLSRISRRVSGNTAGQATVVGAVVVMYVEALSGLISCASTVVGILRPTRELSSSCSAEGICSGNLELLRELIASLAATGNVSGNLTKIVGLSKTTSFISTTDGALKTTRLLIVAVAGAGDAVCLLRVLMELSGTVAAYSTVEGSIPYLALPIFLRPERISVQPLLASSIFVNERLKQDWFKLVES